MGTGMTGAGCVQLFTSVLQLHFGQVWYFSGAALPLSNRFSPRQLQLVQVYHTP